MKRILITGASGFVGSFVVEACLAKDWAVHVAVRSTSSRTYLQDPRIQFHTLSLSDKKTLTDFFRQHAYDAIVHCAGVTKVDTDEAYFKVNHLYTRYLIEALQEAKVVPEKFVFVSSLAAYGPADNKGTDLISESSTPEPLTIYGESKLRAERFIKAQHKFPYIILRPTAVYGPREKDIYTFFKLLKYGVEPYIGSAPQQLTFIYVKDLASIIVQLIDSEHTNKAYFVTDGQAYPADALGSFAKEVLGKSTLKFNVPLPLVRSAAYINGTVAGWMGKNAAFNLEKVKELGSVNWKCDIRALQNDIGFEPQYLLADGIKETIEWYLKNNWL